jgi:hypothetical protein
VYSKVTQVVEPFPTKHETLSSTTTKKKKKKKSIVSKEKVAKSRRVRIVLNINELFLPIKRQTVRLGYKPYKKHT